MSKKSCRFWNFYSQESGQIIIDTDSEYIDGYQFVYARNPYGSHNLIVVDKENNEAIRHGNDSSIDFAEYLLGFGWIELPKIKKLLDFLKEKNVNYEIEDK